jgi:para-aminobenzoate synthetase/4-amino-4-deoxychorismate lyase
VLQPATPPFSLLETLRWEPATGFFLLDRHCNRLAGSAEYFGIALSLPEVQSRLLQWADGQSHLPASPAAQRIRLRVSSTGAISIESVPLPAATDTPVRVALAAKPIDPADRFLYHKTTHRHVYEEAKSDRPGVEDVLLWNSAGQITESTIANMVVDLDGQLITPGVECGLLPGTFRAELLEQGKIREGTIRMEDLSRCRQLYLINSVRKWRKAVLVPS